MSAKTVKTAKARANIAAKMLKAPYRLYDDLGRDFDDCFEMGDGDKVYRLLVAMADADADLTAAIHRRGCGIWLDPAYRATHEALPLFA